MYALGLYRLSCIGSVQFVTLMAGVYAHNTRTSRAHVVHRLSTVRPY